jgi:hypothetical protein
MLDLREHSTSNFNMWSFNNKIFKKWEGEIKVNRGCGILVLSNGKEKETVENESPIIKKVDI